MESFKHYISEGKFEQKYPMEFTKLGPYKSPKELVSDMEKAKHRFPEKQYKYIMMYFRDKKSVKEIQKELGLKSRLSIEKSISFGVPRLIHDFKSLIDNPWPKKK